ncbi:MAG: peptidylprolyl isomerase, partial [Deltaproteobacteria bacterium]|nr:peptidylprolyl isomerase [Deltaproteobacteria bacterium]
LEKEILPKSVDDKLLHEKYNEDWNEYHQPAKYRISRIVVDDKKEAEQIIDKLEKSDNKNALFIQIASARSLDRSTSDKGGDIGYVLNSEDIERSLSDGHKPLVQNKAIEPEVARKAWEIKAPGEIFPEPVKSKNGFEILMLTSIKPGIVRSYETVDRILKSQMLRQLQNEKMDQFVAELRKKADIKINKENLEKLKAELKKDLKEKSDDTDSGMAEDKKISEQ